MAFYIIFGILMFGVLIFIHEFGHFIAAKKCGVGIYEFAIGMGPKIFSRIGKDGVTYSLRLLPIGGFVSMHGEDNDENSENDETSLAKKSIWQRFTVISAGAAMNILLGLVIAALLVIFGGDLYSTKVDKFFVVNKDGIPYTDDFQGLKPNDEIIKVGSRNINIRHDLVYEAMNIVDKPVDLVVLRNGEKVVIKDFYFPTITDKGIVFGTANFFIPTKLEKTPLEVVKQTFCQSLSVLRAIWTSLIDTFKGRYGAEAISGPVGVVSEMKEVEETGGISSLFFMMMVISMNLGIVNLLPFPALDGGRILFLIIEAIRRKPVSPKIEAAVNAAGLMLLMGLMLFVTFSDITKLIK
ncbi:MAG: site-2 protease family protein [Clostridia bacterium]|nr:site-2 protease family protein [Clostridia bacterium]MBQ8759147.1 site-2 protease family protein [Clostridia bacterium]